MTATKTDAYTIRQFEPGDREGFCSLYREVFGGRPEEWFDWKFVDNPYVREVPVCIAEHDGEVVGARPSVIFPMSVGGERTLALMQVDPMVHPDHRGRGLFTRMVEHVYGYYAAREPTISIGFPNEAVKGGLDKLAEKLSLAQGIVGRLPEYYRVQDPGALVSERTDRATYRALGRAGTVAVRGYLRGRDALDDLSDPPEIERVGGVPAGLLADLAASGVPPQAHAVRDGTFYSWRFANPRYDYATYVARRGERAVGALVVGTRRTGGATIVHVSDAVPLGAAPRRDETLSALLGRVVDDHRDATVVAAAGSTVPRSVLGSHGFRSTASFPLSRVSRTNYFVARPLVEGSIGEWLLNGQRLGEPASWRLCFCEREIG